MQPYSGQNCRLQFSTPPTEYKFNVKNLGQSSTLPFHFFSRLNLSLSISFSHLELSSFFHSSSHFLPTSSQVPTKDFSIRIDFKIRTIELDRKRIKLQILLGKRGFVQ
ncbi:hypothetical protein ERO13_A07G157910v2 [Gossypium hirsutum]|uniref:Uncharacterized protein n=1 Tax=Gossypium darwinii TaxID=34276 RepID=A0A5D2FY74_GOSDA|nr:hypothetical protein ERO13_A07G157910v2 [Gossypium hirsutum]TYH10612.1 hypothetical protein ES288_A07G190900v1 [Gossypium darwinii]